MGSILQFNVILSIVLYTMSATQNVAVAESPQVVNNVYINDGCTRGVHINAGADIPEDLGTLSNPASSCEQVKSRKGSCSNGLYYIRDAENNVFPSYCDMTTAGGGWTLVASVHENNMKGRCTTGDRWSSEQGNSAEHPHGDGFWENRATHGTASSATSDDYKNPGYFNMQARDIMIWHVPNDTPLAQFEPEALMKYYTNNGFLTTYGGNLQSLYARHFPIRSKTYAKNTDNGPAIPIIWARGNNTKMVEYTTANLRAGTEPGYVQFRAVNHERNVFALCPGVKIKPPGEGNVEHACIGSTSNNIGHTDEENYCGDYAAKDWPGWSVPDEIITSVVMIFYR